MSYRKWFNYFFVIYLIITSCHHKQAVDFFTNTHLQNFDARFRIASQYKKQLEKFYTKRNFQFAWITNEKLSDRGRYLITRLENEEKDSLYVPLIPSTVFNNFRKDIKKKHGDTTIADLELLLTTAFFDFSRKILIGADDEVMEASGWKIKATKKKFLRYTGLTFGYEEQCNP